MKNHPAVLVWADGRTLLTEGVEAQFHVRPIVVDGRVVDEEWFECTGGVAFTRPESPRMGPPPRDAIVVYVQRPKGGYRE